MACRISEYTRPEWIVPQLAARTKDEALREIARHLASQISELNEVELHQKLQEREQKASTGADHGLAIPHATIASVEALVVAVARAPKGIDFGALDNQQSFVFFTVINPAKAKPGETTYLQAISSICRFMRQPQMRQRILDARSAEEIFKVIASEEATRMGV
ncbi:MAG: PTS sugar transporter subunit IIA [Silvanigrellales bacterium]|jgi:mannitol/fructose-specific phosphotransferase system IIA component (Ntr-type)|nr:PTS sugar transporter subunit IIA [Silvanigrellales bacterium]